MVDEIGKINIEGLAYKYGIQKLQSAILGK
jgi:hypothetical protein